MASNISNRIQSLSPILIDKIAAGEVIDGPYSVVKELIENSVDAGAARVVVETFGGGLEKIIIQDDGHGILYQDLESAVRRHATSKITSLDDIEKILTFGFRGEALASIASVSHLEIKSLREGDDHGGLIECRGGEILRVEPAPATGGTTITVSELFYSTPARKKFLKAERTENTRNQREVIKLALAHPNVHFIYKREGREFLNLPPVNDPRDRIAAIYRPKILNHLIEIDAHSDGVKLRGYITDENHYRANRDGQFQYVNGRHVELKNFSFLVKKSYGELLPHGTHPYFFLFLDADPERIDVNVHPAKKEVRLRDGSLINSLLIQSVSDALRPGEPISFADIYRGRRAAESAAHQNRSAEGSPALESLERILIPDSATGVQSMPEYPIQRGGADILSHDSQKHDLFTGGDSVTMNPGNGVGIGTGDAAGRSSAVELEPPHGNTPTEVDAPAEKGSFLPRRHFGVIFGTYILAEGEDGFYIIDQHTAHERINYERMRNNLEELRGQRQALLHPLSVDCLKDELEEILARKDVLLDCGFLVEEFGPSAYVVREVPSYIEPGTETEAILHVIRRVPDGEDGYRIYDELAAMKACKGSIKKNDYVPGATLSEILVQLSQCENPSRCPHGRPTMIKLAQHDLDRLFHRIR